MAAKRKHGAMAGADEEPVDPTDELMFLCLGGGTEVGRSCHIIQYKGKTVMLDAGMHAGYDGFQALPYYDEFDLSTIDVLLISHFHIDHAASLPYVLAKTNFQGRVFMTHSTKAIYKWLIQDSVRVGNTASSSAESKAQVYTENDHLTTFPKIEAIDYYTTHTVNSIRLTPYPAGHVLGAAMFHIEIAGLSILFTGDYSREQDRHLIPATFPKGIKVDVMITESTYGTASHVPRVERETALMKNVTNILDRGGRVLLPVFALGRAQELLLIFDEYWTRHPEYQNIPIYYASNLARKCMIVYQTYISAMNDNIKRLFRERMAEAEEAKKRGKAAAGEGAGPWDFKFIRSLKSLERFDDVGGCVMLASPGMLQNGVSRELLEKWAPDPKNGVIITGYSVEGTMAKTIMNEPDEIPAVMTKGASSVVNKRGMFGPGGNDEKIMIPRRCSLQEISFAAHVDGPENQEFIQEIDAPVVILVHGEKHNMLRLKSKLMSLNSKKPAEQKTKIYSPANAEEVRIPIRTDKFARIVGRLAERVHPPALKSADEDASADEHQKESLESIVRNSVLVQNDLKYSLMDAEDLREYAGLQTTTITCKQNVKLPSASPELIKWAIETQIGQVEDVTPPHLQKATTNGDAAAAKDGALVEHADEEIDRAELRLVVMDVVRLQLRARGDLEVAWEGNVMNDQVADMVISCLTELETSPAAVRQSSDSHSHLHAHAQPNGVHASAHSQTLAGLAKLGDGDASSDGNAANMPRLDRICMLLETSFGADNVRPVVERKTPVVNGAAGPSKEGQDGASSALKDDPDAAAAAAGGDEDDKGELQPALRIECEGATGLLFLDDMHVEASSVGLRARLQAVAGHQADAQGELVRVRRGLAVEDEGAKSIKMEA